MAFRQIGHFNTFLLHLYEVKRTRARCVSEWCDGAGRHIGDERVTARQVAARDEDGVLLFIEAKHTLLFLLLFGAHLQSHPNLAHFPLACVCV
jgi:hypothetical protein